ncbi:NAD(P)H-flavin reductase [Streptomyces sp. TLI_235]|nr:FAD/NAD(P)-binding protein [Streptomyces sp. TLI_235]PBC75881.1 NAD(P)H-flavin reductase [Streptomyces sp. TLI_235]
MSAVPVPYRVASARPETADSVSLGLVADGPPLPAFSPGQFAMVYAFGVGEVPISVSAIDDGGLTFTVRSVGAVSGALCRLGPGGFVGLRGPYGAGWNLHGTQGADVLVVAGGIGLAPLRPVVHRLLGAAGNLAVLVGTRTPADLLYPDELAVWSASARVEVTVDRPDEAWPGSVGVVTSLLDRVRPGPRTAAALVCGPEVMMRRTADALLARGVPAERIQLSLERNMRCGTGHCGHCQLGPLLLCRDGPVVDCTVSRQLLSVREL